MTNITVISANPHTHLTGISVDTKIIRNGVDIGYLFANHEYDFNYQQSYLLNPYVNITIVKSKNQCFIKHSKESINYMRWIIFKNDELITKCVYNTKDRTGFTIVSFTIGSFGLIK